MIIKVCGMREPDNITQLATLQPDWMGLIFYPSSPRYAGNLPAAAVREIPCRKVGVFVNATTEEILEKVNTYRLDFVQLHGEETPDDCYAIQKRGIAVIKAFPVSSAEDLSATTPYEGRADYFLFDTRSAGYGGSGRSFDWSLLSRYTSQTPFLLSGGIHPGCLGCLRQFSHPHWAGIDLNSGFETAPGQKDIPSLRSFMHALRHTFIHTFKTTTAMNRIQKVFETKKNDILSVYFTAGFPRLDDTLPILRALQAKGIDMVEIGIPFSDPMADGPVIQASSAQALHNGMSLHLLIEQLADVRKEISIPLIFMGYLNPIMQYGFERFCQDCVTTGIDGVIIPDLPFADYLANYKPVADRYGLCVIMLVSPETSDERIRQIDRYTQGFIYVVSSASTTGAQSAFDEERQAYFRRIQSMQLQNPHLIGFGISNKATFQTATTYAPGAIIGSRFIQLLQGEPTVEQAVEKLCQEVR